MNLQEVVCCFSHPHFVVASILLSPVLKHFLSCTRDILSHRNVLTHKSSLLSTEELVLFVMLAVSSLTSNAAGTVILFHI